MMHPFKVGKENLYPQVPITVLSDILRKREGREKD